MVDEEINLILQDLGLSNKEVSVYLSLLQLGEETASRVSEIANLNRVTTYTVLKSLEEKGFCSVYIKNKVQYFKPIKPEQIISLIEERKNKVRTIIPKLKGKQKIIKEKPEVSLYEGKKGLTALLNLIIKDAKAEKLVLAYGNFTKAEKLVKYQSLHWRKSRIKNKIKIKAIIDNVDKKFLEYSKTPEYESLTEIKLLKELSNLNTYTLISKNYTAYIAEKGQLIGVLIKNKEIAEKERFNFELMWKQAE